MKKYFILQLRLLNRQLTDLGIEPIIGYVIGFFSFIAISISIFEKTQWAEYLFVIGALSLVIRCNEKKRNDFLKLYYSKRTYFKLRIVENLILSIAFVLFLIVKEKYLSAIILTVLVCFFSILDSNSNLNFTLPTPFYKHPFEFTAGFRTNFYLYFIAYILAFMAILVANFNLGIFSLILVFLFCLNYYSISEDKFYVWIFSIQPKEFISYKIKNIIQYSTILSLPIICSLALFFYNRIDIIVGFYLLGCLLVCIIMLAKYSVFPQKLNIKFGIVLAFILWLPPLLLLFIPYLYIQSRKKLKEIL